jgi:murein DD-endopeptidase MepM/ murein hydrolase activator NlpD
LLVLWLGVFATATVGAAASGPVKIAAENNHFEVTFLTPEVETGGTLVVQIDCRRAKTCPHDLRLSFYNQTITIFPHPVKGPAVQLGLVGIPLAASPGKTHLSLAWDTEGRRFAQKAFFEIRAGVYGEESIKVDPRHVRPSSQDLERIRREQEELNRIYASGTRSRLWQGAFRLPVPGEMNGPFGTRRVFNGELRSQHTGVDFRAQTGDPVQAASSGVVRLSKELFYSGNAVIIDHGAGVFTSYSHLSQFTVKAGQKVEKGQTVGLAGATGRATGPHLHWGVKINSINVNPLSFVRVTERLEGG